MKYERLVIFDTNDIMQDKPRYPGQHPNFAGEIVAFKKPEIRGLLKGAGFPDRLHLERWSTGRLEHALTLGLEPYVCSMRPAFDVHDEWWRELVPPDNVFLFTELDSGRVHITQISRMSLLAWRRLYAKLGLEWDEQIAKVSEARARLIRHGVTDGRTLGSAGGNA